METAFAYVLLVYLIFAALPLALIAVGIAESMTE